MRSTARGWPWSCCDDSGQTPQLAAAHPLGLDPPLQRELPELRRRAGAGQVAYRRDLGGRHRLIAPQRALDVRRCLAPLWLRSGCLGRAPELRVAGEAVHAVKLTLPIAGLE